MWKKYSRWLKPGFYENHQHETTAWLQTPPKADSARPRLRLHRNLSFIPWNQSYCSQNLIKFFRIARNKHSYIEAWQTLVIMLEKHFTKLYQLLSYVVSKEIWITCIDSVEGF